MSISGQQPINIGLPNESINSDSLYTAFTKTQQNFDTLFDNASPFVTFIGNTGISTSANASNGSVTITNTGVTNIIAGTNIVVNQSNGNVTISSTGGGGGGGGTVTSVGLVPVSSSRLAVTNSPIISSGNMGIDLVPTGITAGAYINPNVTVDTYGRVTAIQSGGTPGTVTSVGLTAGPGVQVNGGPITTIGNIVVTNTGVIKLTAGNGIDLSAANGNVTVSVSGGVGTVSSVGVYSSSLIVTNSPITTAGTIGIELPASPTITGNLTVANADLGFLATAQYFSGDGSNLTNLSAANIVGTVGSATTSGTVTTNAQPNITSLGTLNSLAVVASANPSLGNNVTANFFTGSGQNLSNIQAANVVGTVGSASNATRVATTLVATGVYYLPFISATPSANYGLNSNAAFSANLANGALIATTFVGTLSGAATTAGTVTTASQGNITSVGTLTSLAVTGTTGITSTDSAGVVGTVKIIRAVNGTQDIGLIPRAGTGAYNNLTAAEDAAIVFGNSSAQGNANLTIAPWANATSGIRIQSISNAATIFLNAANTNVSSILNTSTLNASGNISGANVTVTSYNIRSISGAITAAGTNQGTATVLSKEINIVSSVAPGTGVVLPSAVAGMVLIINNTSTNTLNVYPAANAAINNGAANAAYSHVAGSSLQYYATGATQWYTVGATFA